jgi:hypothetical protein
MLHRIFVRDGKSPFSVKLPTDSAEEPGFHFTFEQSFTWADGVHMATITLRGDDAAFMQDLSAQLAQDLQRVGLDADVQLNTASNEEVIRGDPASVGMIIATAVAAGGALTVFLGKDGGLSALAKVLEKHIESRKVEVAIETDDGKKVKVSGSLAAIKAVLKQV